jgi:hypothetical protein
VVHIPWVHPEEKRRRLTIRHLGETVSTIDQLVIPQIVALPLDQVKRDEGDVMIIATGSQRVEIGQPVTSANHGFAIASTMAGNRSAQSCRPA